MEAEASHSRPGHHGRRVRGSLSDPRRGGLLQRPSGDRQEERQLPRRDNRPNSDATQGSTQPPRRSHGRPKNRRNFPPRNQPHNQENTNLEITPETQATNSDSQAQQSIDTSSSMTQASSSTSTQSKVQNKSTSNISFREKRILGLKQVPDEGDPESQRKKFEELLKSGKYDCMICCEEILPSDPIWTCYLSCFNMFHLKCIGTWAGSDYKQVVTGPSNNSQQPKPGWRCPACQNVFHTMPNKYYCFCGKLRNPSNSSTLTPHSCGQLCYKRRNGRNSKCPHRCQLPCHPGPCPPCEIGSFMECSCGRTTKKIPCGAVGPIFIACTFACDKTLNCGQHKCTRLCHEGPCDSCSVQVDLKCYCGRNSKPTTCTSQDESHPGFSCGVTCNKGLACGHHKCKRPCHEGPCGDCKRSPLLVKTCACGKTPIESFADVKRISCKDPLPSCGKPCEFKFNCGPINDAHKCPKICHDGQHPPCKLKTSYKCNCGSNTMTIECVQMKERSFICNRRCNKKLSCGRHKCSQACCKNSSHICNSICDKKLSCNRHKCPEVCHTGNCPPCWNVSWEELSCHCGHTVKYPPIQCGDQIPQCDRPCSRVHNCNHPVEHTCHSNDECPPCTKLTYRPCFGGHDMIPNVACCVSKISCGRPCKKLLSCGMHTCLIPCHDGECNECRNFCSKTRPCGHPCNETCHSMGNPICPDTPCKIAVQVHCPCKRLTGKMTCYEVNKSSHKVSMTMLARMGIINENETLSVDELIKKTEEYKFARLECDEKCGQIERNRNLANALNIQEPDLNPELVPKYPESLKQAYLHYPDFVKETYDTLVNLIHKAEMKANKSAVYNFPTMRSDLRSIIHELAEFMGLKSSSVDKEPNRSVVVKAVFGKCTIPAVSLMDAMSLRKALKTDAGAKKTIEQTKPEVKKPVIDYFDFDGSD